MKSAAVEHFIAGTVRRWSVIAAVTILASGCGAKLPVQHGLYIWEKESWQPLAQPEGARVRRLPAQTRLLVFDRDLQFRPLQQSDLVLHPVRLSQRQILALYHGVKDKPFAYKVEEGRLFETVVGDRTRKHVTESVEKRQDMVIVQFDLSDGGMFLLQAKDLRIRCVAGADAPADLPAHHFQDKWIHALDRDRGNVLDKLAAMPSMEDFATGGHIVEGHHVFKVTYSPPAAFSALQQETDLELKRLSNNPVDMSGLANLCEAQRLARELRTPGHQAPEPQKRAAEYLAGELQAERLEAVEQALAWVSAAFGEQTVIQGLQAQLREKIKVREELDQARHARTRAALAKLERSKDDAGKSVATHMVPAVPTGAFFETAVDRRVEILTNQLRISSQGKPEPELIWLGAIAKLGRQAESAGERVRHRVRIFGRSQYDGSLERLEEFTLYDAKAASALFAALHKAVQDWRALHQEALASSLTADDKDFRGQAVWIEGEHVGFSWNDAPFYVRLPDAGSGPKDKRTVRKVEDSGDFPSVRRLPFLELKAASATPVIFTVNRLPFAAPTEEERAQYERQCKEAETLAAEQLARRQGIEARNNRIREEQEAQRRKWQEQQDREWNELKMVLPGIQDPGSFPR